MAALDFGMALARGMLPKSEIAQKDLLNLAGGRNIFKSEDWWNKAVDKQIKEGFRESEKGTEYLTKSGQYVLGKRTASQGANIGLAYGFGGGGPSVSYSAPTDAKILGYRLPSVILGGPSGQTPIYETRQVEVYGDFSPRKDYTAGELKDIETAAKRGAEQAKRTAAETQATKRRLSRATGGLMGKARAEGEAPATGLPALGEGGLGIVGSILGGGIKL